MTDSVSVERDGVRVNQLVITSATPAVLEEVCRKITADVIAQIPTEAFKNIADDIIKNGQVVRKPQSSWESPIRWSIAERVEALVRESLEKRIQDVVFKLFQVDAVKAALVEQFKDAFATAMEAMPRMMAMNLFDRMADRCFGPDHGRALENMFFETKKDVESIRTALKSINIQI